VVHGAAAHEHRDPAAERRRFGVDEVLRMIADGIFGEDERVELVQGEILSVNPQGPDHGSLKDELHARLAGAYAGRDVHILNQRPVRAGARGLPEPDLAVVRGAARNYLDHHPTGTDLVLVVELAKTSQARDRDKAADYAAGGVTSYWLVDLVTRVVEVHSDPDAELGRFRSVVVLDDEDELALPELDLRWSVASLLP
jgi:Uma2 family endonuclease